MNQNRILTQTLDGQSKTPIVTGRSAAGLEAIDKQVVSGHLRPLQNSPSSFPHLESTVPAGALG